MKEQKFVKMFPFIANSSVNSHFSQVIIRSIFGFFFSKCRECDSSEPLPKPQAVTRSTNVWLTIRAPVNYNRKLICVFDLNLIPSIVAFPLRVHFVDRRGLLLGSAFPKVRFWLLLFILPEHLISMEKNFFILFYSLLNWKRYRSYRCFASNL